MIKVSFIVIGYNVEKYISKCLNSIINQTMAEIEIIYVDDGSQDNSVKVANNIGKNDSRIKIIEKENEGPHKARMTGLTKARGKYVIFVDGDDWVASNLAEKTYNIAEEKKVDIVVYNFSYVYSNKKYVRHNNKVECNKQYNNYLKLIMSNLISNNIWDKLIKKELLLKDEIINFYGMRVGEDLVLNVFLGIYNPLIYAIEDQLYFYLQRNNSVMNKSTSKILEIEIALDYVKDILVKNKLFDIYNEEYNYLCFLHYYISRVVRTKLKSDKFHKQMYHIWKSKNIKYQNNKYCKAYINNMNIYNRILLKLFDINYGFGVKFLKLKHIKSNMG